MPLAADENAARSQLALADGWRFHRGSAAGADHVDFDDAGWEVVRVPHTWNAADGQDGGGDYFRGDGWYRLRFQVPSAWRDRNVYLQFGAANRSAEAFLNGQRLGEHRGGYARFRFDATSALRFDGDNVLAVRVNNGAGDAIAPIHGDFTFFGGLYREVSLFATDRVHVETLDHASPGVFLDPLAVSADEAEVAARVEVVNHEPDARDVRVRVEVLADQGRLVQATEVSRAIAAGEREEVVQRFKLAKPRLWDGLRDPFVYRVRVTLLTGTDVRDVVEQPLGLRFFAVDPDRGFSLNGRALDLRGANRHHDRADLGSAISEQEDREDLAIMLEMGCNMDRTSHYQQSAEWYDLADRAGVVLWTEIPLVYDVIDSAAFFESCRIQLRELIRQNYNHPSILFWGIGNESFVRDPSVTPPETNLRLIRELAALARAEDPRRLSTYASNGDVTEPRASAPDVVGFNHYFGWYHDAPEDLAGWLDRQRAERPGLRIGMSEYGAGANPAQHEEPARRPEPAGPWHPEEWQARFHEVHWGILAQRPWVWCKLVWCMFDAASDSRGEGGTPGINDKGLVSHDRRIRKDAFYWYQANWSEVPMVHLTSRRFAVRTEASTPVRVYSNAPTVELTVNGVSQGVQSAAHHLFLWPDVRLTPGANHIVARATSKAATLTDECVWRLEPAAP